MLAMANRHSKLWCDRDWSWPDEDIHCWKHLHKHGPRIVQDITGLLPTDQRNLVIQAGGNCGMYPYEYVKHFKKVVTFEPCYRNFKHLIINNPSSRITAVNGALGQKSGEFVPIRNSTKNSGATHVTTIPKIATSFAMTFALDDLGLKPDLIHLDVEGFELEVIQGARRLLKEVGPLLVVEIKKDNRFLFWEYLREFSYTESGVLENGDYIYEKKR